MQIIPLNGLRSILKTAFLFCLICLSGNMTGQFRVDKYSNKPFKAGEKLIYTVKFGPIVGGYATLELKQKYYNNKLVYHARGEGRTVGLAEKLYRVKDIFESYFDTNSILPYKAIRDVREGNYKKHEEAVFNKPNNTVYSTRKDTVISVPDNILDMVSLLYYLRSLDLKNLQPGSVLHTMTFFDEELYPFDIRFRGKEVVKTKFGKIKCYRFDPVVEPGRMFDSEDDMTIWISDDMNLIPIKVRFDLLVGSLHIELSEYSNLQFPLGII